MKVGIVVGANITITDTAGSVEGMTTAEIAGLPAVGIIGISATEASVTLSVAQALALETAAVTLAVPTGDVAALADTATDIEGLTPTQIASLSTLHVTQLQATDAPVTLDVAQALALETAGVTLSMPPGDSAAVVDTAANIEALTTTQIASLSSSLHVGEVEASDTNVAITTAQTVAFENASVALAAPIGSTVSISDTAAHLQSLTAAQIAAFPLLSITQLNSTDANVSYAAAQTTALQAGGVTLSAAGAHTVTENYANGNSGPVASCVGIF